MATMQKIHDADEIRNRAEMIRRNWSRDERQRRHGLPPDMPSRMQQFIFGSSSGAWVTAPVYAR